MYDKQKNNFLFSYLHSQFKLFFKLQNISYTVFIAEVGRRFFVVHYWLLVLFQKGPWRFLCILRKWKTPITQENGTDTDIFQLNQIHANIFFCYLFWAAVLPFWLFAISISAKARNIEFFRFMWKHKEYTFCTGKKDSKTWVCCTLVQPRENPPGVWGIEQAVIAWQHSTLKLYV